MAVRRILRLLGLLGFLGLAACTGYVLVPPGRAAVGDGLTVTADEAWNRATNLPLEEYPRELWTRDGLRLNSISFMTGIGDGHPVTPDIIGNDGRSGGAEKGTLPVFRKDMVAPEIMELFDATFVRLLGTPLVTADNLRPTTFAGLPGFRFDVAYTDRHGLDRRAVVAGAVRDGKLYLICYMAARLHYFDRHLPEAEAIIASARFS